MLNTFSRRLSSSGKRFGSFQQNSLHPCSINHLFLKVPSLSLPQGLSGREGKLLKNQCQSPRQLSPYRVASKSERIVTLPFAYQSCRQWYPYRRASKSERILTLQSRCPSCLQLRLLASKSKRV